MAADYPINVFPHNTMGIAQQLGRTDEAVRAYRRALIVDPGYGGKGLTTSASRWGSRRCRGRPRVV